MRKRREARDNEERAKDGEGKVQRRHADMSKITVIECANSSIKNYTQLFKFGFEI